MESFIKLYNVCLRGDLYNTHISDHENKKIFMRNNLQKLKKKL